MALYYLDTSAAFKLLASEEHAEAFLAFYREHRGDNWISSDLLRIDVSRAVARTWPALIPDAQRLLDAFEYVQIDEDVVRSAIRRAAEFICRARYRVKAQHAERVRASRIAETTHPFWIRLAVATTSDAVPRVTGGHTA